MIHLRPLVATLALLAACAVPAGKPLPSWLDAAKVTVKLQTPTGGGGSAFPIEVTDVGSGSYSVLLMTAAHVVRDWTDESGQVRLDGWVARVADERVLGSPVFVAMHDTLDVALVRVTFTNARGFHALRLRATPAEVGERVWAIGYPGAARRVITEGYVGQRGCASAEVFPGNSGGPLVDAAGDVVGIVVMVGTFGLGFGRVIVEQDMIFLPIEDVLEWASHWL